MRKNVLLTSAAALMSIAAAAQIPAEPKRLADDVKAQSEQLRQQAGNLIKAEQ